MKNLVRKFLIGLSILLPVAVSVQLAIWLIRTVESWLRPIWIFILPQNWYLPGFAIVSFVLVAVLIGISANLPVFKQVWNIPGRLMENTPVIRTVYATIKDLLNLLSGEKFSDQSVVWVSIPESGGRLLGIVTKSGSEKQSSLGKIIEEDEVAVYLPMSYNAGGYMVILPKDRLEYVKMEPGDALRLIMSSGLGQS